MRRAKNNKKEGVQNNEAMRDERREKGGSSKFGDHASDLATPGGGRSL
jgi:hypothetical protein